VTRIALIANPRSGSGEAARVAALLAEAGADVDGVELEAPGDIGSAERIAVAGGDGSVAEAAARAAAAGVPLAVIATGTANDFAAHFGLPDNLDAACRLAVGGTQTRSIELPSVCGRPFVNVVGAGLPPAAAAEAGGLKEDLGALAYPAGAVGAGLRAEPIRCAAMVDGERLFAGYAWQASVAGSGAFGGGAGFRTDPADGMLDAIVIEGSSRARLVKHALGLRLGDVERQRGVVSARGRRIELELDPDESLNVDGELVDVAALADDGRLRFETGGERFELIVG
jgi:diacylglycerol kinase (ATP)